jgi:hypothetical protein
MVEEDECLLAELTRLGVSMADWLISADTLVHFETFCTSVLVNFTVRQSLVDQKFLHGGEDNGYKSIGRD